MTQQDILIDLHYLPCIEYFYELTHAKRIFIEAHENFQKQSYRNRAYIVTSQKKEALSIPLAGSNSHLPIQEIKIDYTQKWDLIHQRAIQAAYGKAPYFEYFGEELFAIYQKKHTHLFELNMDLLTYCLKRFKINTPLEITTSYIPKANLNPEIKDLRGEIHPKKTSSFTHKSYYQTFGNNFEKNLSAIDYLFCEGNSIQSLF